MKQSSLMTLAILVGIYLSACSSRLPASQEVPVGVGSLNTAEAYLRRGDEYATNKDYDLAIADYSQAIQLKPGYAEAYNNRGYAYYWNYESTKAIADYSQAIKLRPDYAYA